MRKAIVAMILAVVSASAAAVMCGPVVQTSRLTHLGKSLRATHELLLQHNRSLLNEAGGLLGRTPSDAVYEQVEKIHHEIALLDTAIADISSVQGSLDATSTLASIRDVMVDKRDRTIVELYLSIDAFLTRKKAELSYRSTNESLRRMSRPSVAGDVSTLRDAIGVVLRELEKCESPKVPARVPQTRPQ